MSTRSWVLLLVLTTSRLALGDVYSDAKDLAEPMAKGESVVDATKRWQRGLAKLDAVPAAQRKDYRYCYWRAVLSFRLDGADAMKTDRYDCTALQVAGTRIDAANTTPEDRARGVNALSALADAFYKEEIARLARELKAAKDTGGGKVIIAWKAVDQLVKSGKLSKEDAKAVLRELEEASKAFDKADLRIDSTDANKIDINQIDWSKFKKEDFDKLPPDVKDRINNSGFGPGQRGGPNGSGPRSR